MPQRLANRVLLIGWDAADWQMIDPLLQAGQMPALARFLSQGVRANIATLHPIISPILWNSIATGKLADKHGILGFLEPDGEGGLRPVSSTSRQAKAVWNILSQSGLRSTVVNWFASAPAERINGVVVTDRVQQSVCEETPAPMDERSIWPPEMVEPLSELILSPNDVTAETAQFFVPEITRFSHDQNPFPSALAKLVAECGTTHNAATHLLETEPFDFMAVYYDTIDHFGHLFMEFHPPAMEHVTEEEARVLGGAMNAVYRYHDLMLGRLLTLAGPDTTVIIISDHGFHNGALRPRLFVDPETHRKSGAGLNPIAWHRPYGIFAASGPGIKKGAEINGVTLLDICPTILTLMGLPVAQDMDGRPVLHMFENPPEVAVIPTYEGEHPSDGVHRGEMAQDSYSAHEALKQLADLGYIAPLTGDMAQTTESVLRDRKSNLAQALFSTHRSKEAEKILRELVAEAPSSKYLSRLAMCLVEQERFDEAERLLADMSSDPAEAPVATMLMAQIRFGQGRYADAAELAAKVTEFGIKFAGIYSQLGQIHAREGRWEAAEKAFRDALATDPDDAESLDGLGMTLRNGGRAEEAVYLHMRSVALEPRRSTSHVNLGLALADMKQFDWAIRALLTASELSPDAPQPHLFLAQLYGQVKKDREAAERHMARATELRDRATEKIKNETFNRGFW